VTIAPRKRDPPDIGKSERDPPQEAQAVETGHAKVGDEHARLSGLNQRAGFLRGCRKLHAPGPALTTKNVAEAVQHELVVVDEENTFLHISFKRPLKATP
jgi:hypothetical protein